MAIDPRLGALAVGTGDPLAQITQELADLRGRLAAIERGGGVFAPWVQPTLGASFTHGSPAIKYYRDSSGSVYLSGVATYVEGGALTPLFNLPIGFRPIGTIHCPISVFVGAPLKIRHLQITSGGSIVLSGLEAADFGQNCTLYVDGVQFKVG